MASSTSDHPYKDLRVPNEAPLRLDAAPGQGWGAFAVRDIARGELILRESALFTIHKPQHLIDEGDLITAVHGLPSASQQQFLHLRDNGTTRFSRFTDAFAENCFTFPPSPSTGFSSTGCFILLSRINHSCLPNAKIPDSDIRGTAIACFAMRDIAKGEEILFCYNPGFEFRTAASRHSQLRFACECRACKPGTRFHQLSEMRRALLRGLQYLLQGCDIDGGQRGTHIIFDRELRNRAENFDVGVADRLVYTVLKMVLLEQEGLLDDLMVQRLRPGLSHLIDSLETAENLLLVHRAMQGSSWEECLGACLVLCGKRDAGDAALTLQLRLRRMLHL